ncbi:MAG: Tol-Pal system beta propeller repeat protein TolB [Chromatiales bacterium]|nr:Tol-Pal system beta propeller repeat protein TolB [Chromatiales bacterium]
MLRRLSLVTAAMLLCLAGPAKGQLEIVISRGVDKPVPVAIVPFGWDGPGEAPIDVAAIVAANLERSGRFAALDRADMLQRPTTGAEIDFRSWRMVAVDALVVGQLQQSPNGDYAIQFQLFDALRGEQLLGYRLPVSAAALRSGTHRVSDLIYERLTGVPGVFSTRIAWVSVSRAGRADARYRLVVADADGENEQVMFESPQPIMSPSWSPDGRRIAYVSFENGVAEIYIQTLRTGDRIRASARPGVNSAPSFSPDGRRLALTLSRDGNLDIYTLDVAGQVLTRITDWPSIETEPVWSADGRTLYFTSDRSGNPQIYRVGSDGGRPERITFEGRYNARPRLSPDGRQLAVVHNDRGNYRIAVLDLARGSIQVLSDGRDDESPSFAPNGEMIIYATREGGRGVLATVSADGRVRQRLSSGGEDVREPAWSPFLLAN